MVLKYVLWWQCFIDSSWGDAAIINLLRCCSVQKPPMSPSWSIRLHSDNFHPSRSLTGSKHERMHETSWVTSWCKVFIQLIYKLYLKEREREKRKTKTILVYFQHFIIEKTQIHSSFYYILYVGFPWNWMQSEQSIFSFSLSEVTKMSACIYRGM